MSFTDAHEGGYKGFFDLARECFSVFLNDYGFAEGHASYCDMGPCIGFHSDTVFIETCIDHRGGEIDLWFGRWPVRAGKRPFHLQQLIALENPASTEKTLWFARDCDSMKEALSSLAAILKCNGQRMLHGDEAIF